MNSVTALAYHRIETPGTPNLAPTVIDAYPGDFEAQMRYVASRFNVVSSWDLVRALREGFTLPKRALIITFDDGYRSFSEAALPVLQRLGLPVTLFVVTKYLDSPGALFWWDRLYRALALTHKTRLEVPGIGGVGIETQEQRRALFDRLGATYERTEAQAAARLVDSVVESCDVKPNTEHYLLDWAEIAELEQSGVSIGPHSRNHLVLSRATPERARDEIEGSWADLEARITRPLPLFCYPTGKPHAVNASVAAIVRQAGLAGAFTMVAGLNVVGRTNPYLLYRVGLLAGESLPKFAFKLTPAVRVYRRVKMLVSREAAAELKF